MRRNAQQGDRVGQGKIAARCSREGVSGAIQFCVFEHCLPVNTRRFCWLLGEAIKIMACCKRVGVWRGVGRDWDYQHWLALVGVVCGGDDSDWWIPGPVNGLEWRREYKAVDRRTEANNLDFPSVAAVTMTPGTVNAGESAGRKRRGKKARERLRRRIEASRRGD